MDRFTYKYYYQVNGQLMATYNSELFNGTQRSTILEEQYIYGSNRIGTLKANKGVYFKGTHQPAMIDIQSNKIGKKRYELTNHLGNVLATISDRKIYNSTDGYYESVITMKADYYAFGMLQPGRFEGIDESRHLFNGMEADNEISGSGNSYTTEFRQYDPRLGRWKSLDPLMAMFPNMSPYVGFANNPIFFTDPYGLAPTNGDEGEPVREIEEVTVTGTDKTPKLEPYRTPSRINNAVKEQGLVFLSKTTSNHSFNDNGALTSFVDGEFIYKWDSEKEWYYDNYYNKKYDEGSYGDGHSVAFNPSISGAEKGFEGFKYMIEDLGKNIELMIREMKKPGYFTTYWTLSPYQKGLFDGGSLSGLVEGLPTTILSGLAAKGLGSFGISQTNIRAFGFSANNGRGLLNGPRTIGNYKLDLMYSNPSVGFSSGTFFSIKSLKAGGNMLRWDYGLIHNSSSFGIHSTFRFNINGTTYGSSKQFSRFAPFVFWNYPQK